MLFQNIIFTVASNDKSAYLLNEMQKLWNRKKKLRMSLVLESFLHSLLVVPSLLFSLLCFHGPMRTQTFCCLFGLVALPFPRGLESSSGISEPGQKTGGSPWEVLMGQAQNWDASLHSQPIGQTQLQTVTPIWKAS